MAWWASRKQESSIPRQHDKTVGDQGGPANEILKRAHIPPQSKQHVATKGWFEEKSAGSMEIKIKKKNGFL